MTFTFKLSRRLALSHMPLLTALVALVSSCAPGQPLEGGLEPPPGDVLSIQIFPDSVSLNSSEFVDFTAVAELQGGGTGPVAVSWEAEGGSISTAGRYVAGSTAGTYRVIGRHQNGKADTSLVVITEPAPGPVLTGIEVTPSTAALLPGDPQDFTATGRVSDGSTTAVTVTWTATGGTITAAGHYTAPAGAGTYRVVATQQGGGFSDTAQVSVTIPPPTLVAVELTPASAALEFGQSQQFAASGRLSDGSSTAIAVTWTATGGSVNANGRYTAGNSAGSFRVIARSANGLADTSSVTVSAPTITGVTLTPASVALQSGQTQQFSVSATLSNGGTQSNPSVTWVATGGAVNATGLYTAGGAAGGFRVIATSSNGKADTSTVTISLPTITAITVTPPTATVGAGQTQQFSASATLSNGGTQSNPNVAWTATGGTITSGGLYTAGNTAGSFRVIAASGNGKADTSAVTVTATAPTLAQVILTPATVALATGATQQFTVSGRMSDGSTSTVTVTYTATGGTITSGGLYTAGATAGSFRVIAIQQGGTLADTSTVTVTVTQVPVATVTVTPPSLNLNAGQTGQLTATLKDAGGNVLTGRTVTWATTAASVATVNSSGLVTGQGSGSATITATSGGQTGSATATVTVQPVATVTVTPSAPSLAVGETATLTATLKDAAGNVLTGRTVTWSTTAASVATVNSVGLVTGQGVGTATVTATSEGQSGTSAVTVSSSTFTVPDVLNNASFESGFDGFVSGSGGTPNGVVRSTEQAFNGTTSVKVAWNAGGGEVSAQSFHDIGAQTHFWTRYWYYITPALPNGTGFKFVRYQDGGFNVANGMQILNGSWVWVGNSNEAIAYTNSSPIVGGWHYVEFEWDRTAKQIRMWQDGTPMQGASADAGLSWSGTTLTYTSDIGPRNLDLIRVINAPTNSGAVYLDRIAVSTKGRIGP